MHTEHAPRRSWRSVALLIGSCITLVLVLVLIGQVRAAIDPQARAAAEAERYRQLQIDERLDWLDTAVAAGWRLVPLLLVAGGGTIGLLAAYNRLARADIVKAEKVIALERATTQRFPAGLHTLSFHDSSKQLVEKEEERALLPGPAIEAPTMAALLTSGAIGQGKPLILGYSEEGAMTGNWKSLYSSGIGGLQGSGKTWCAAFLLAQSALSGAKLVVCDPHAHDSESLARRVGALAPAFVCGIAEDDKEILAALRLADNELQSRKKGNADRTPMIVAIDEWASLRRGALASVLPSIVEDFSTEGRKLNCHLLLLSQRWDKIAVGDFRNTLASSYVYRMRADEARMMTGMRAEMLPKDTLQLEPGSCYLLNTYGQLSKVRIPLMTDADVAEVGQRLAGSPGGSPGGSTARPFGFVPRRAEPGAEPYGSTLPNAAEPHSAKVEEVRRLLAAKCGTDEIIRQVWGIESKGRAYTKAREELLAIIALLVKVVR